MTRLTNQIREEILSKLLVHGYKARVQAAVDANAAFALKVYEDVFSKDLAKIRSLPHGWLVTDTDIKVQFGATIQRLYFKGTLGTYNLEAPMRNCGAQLDYESKQPMPYSKKEAVVAQYGGDHPLVAEFDKLKSEFDELEIEIRTTKATIESSMNSVSTVKKLIDVWPEVEDFAKSYLEVTTPNLPTIPREKLNKLLELPPET